MTNKAKLVWRRVRLRNLLLVAGAALALGAVACSSDDPEPTAVPPAPTSTSAPAPTAAPAVIDTSSTDADLVMVQVAASVIVPLGALNDSGQTGVVVLMDMGDTTEVVVDISPGAADVPQPIHIHAGTCDTLGEVKFALSDIVNGRSVTNVKATLAEITTGGFTINGHKSGDEIGVYIACGNVPRGDKAGTFRLASIGGSAQDGSVSFIDLGGETAVVISVGSAASGLAQPVHIHEGACDTLGDVKFPLTNVVDGRSVTLIGESISNVMRDGFVVNLHRSADEIAVYTACGSLSDSAPAVSSGAAMDAMADDLSGDLMMAQVEASIIVALTALNDSGQSGVAILLDKGDKTEVVVDIGPGAADVPQPIHIHAGTCDSLGDVAFALSDVVNGRSVTSVDASLAEITTGGFTINGHKSGDEIGVYVACGNVPRGDEVGTFSLAAIDGSAQDGSVSFIDLGSKTAVVISVGAGAAGVEQPVHIHEGSCDTLGGVKFPLTNVVDGRSVTLIDDSIANVLRDGTVVNLHRSVEEIAVYTACGSLAASAASAAPAPAAPVPVANTDASDDGY